MKMTDVFLSSPLKGNSYWCDMYNSFLSVSKRKWLKWREILQLLQVSITYLIMQIFNSDVWTNSLPEYNWNWLIKGTLTFWDWREIQHIAIYFNISLNIQCSTDYFCYLYNGVLIHNEWRASLGQHMTELLLRPNVLNDGAKWPNQVISRLFYL